MPKFKDPKTGQTVNVNYFLVFLSCLFFGLFFFLYIGETQHALVMICFAILVILANIFVLQNAILYACIFSLVYSFIAPKIVQDKWLKKGYTTIINDNKSQQVENKKIKQTQASKESIQGKTIIINLCGNLITLVIVSFIVIGFSEGRNISDVVDMLIGIIVSAIFLTTLNIADTLLKIVLPLPNNKYIRHIHILSYCYLLFFSGVFFFLPVVGLNIFVKRYIKEFFVDNIKL